jgi:hypothetical protein
MPERYDVEIVETEVGPGAFVVVTDAATGRRLSGLASLASAPLMVGCLIEDHRERRDDRGATGSGDVHVR